MANEPQILNLILLLLFYNFQYYIKSCDFDVVAIVEFCYYKAAKTRFNAVLSSIFFN